MNREFTEEEHWMANKWKMLNLSSNRGKMKLKQDTILYRAQRNKLNTPWGNRQIQNVGHSIGLRPGLYTHTIKDICAQLGKSEYGSDIRSH